MRSYLVKNQHSLCLTLSLPVPGTNTLGGMPLGCSAKSEVGDVLPCSLKSTYVYHNT